jgi:hypothetical protein
LPKKGAKVASFFVTLASLFQFQQFQVSLALFLMSETMVTSDRLALFSKWLYRYPNS